MPLQIVVSAAELYEINGSVPATFPTRAQVAWLLSHREEEGMGLEYQKKKSRVFLKISFEVMFFF